MKKNVFDFEMSFSRRTCYGDFYRASGFIGGKCYMAEKMFLGYTKKEIIRLLKNNLLAQANR